MSPSISALGVSAATESMTTTSILPVRIRESTISSACSPVSGWEMRRSSTLTPILRGVIWIHGVLGIDVGADAAFFLGFGDDVKGKVVLPDDSGPKISMMRPQGRPPMPSAMSSPKDPVEIASTSTGCSFLPSRMTEPLPKFRSIWLNAASRAFCLSMLLKFPSITRNGELSH